MKDDLKISNQEFAAFKTLIRELTGIKLADSKTTFVIARLASRVRQLGLPNFSEYIHHLSSNSSASEIEFFIDKMTTNETYFFREDDHFDFLYCVAFFKKKNINPVRVWSCACSSGDEPYTIAMLCEEFIKIHQGFRYQILASDISKTILSKAQLGLYSEESLRKTPEKFKAQYFKKREDNQWELVEKIKKAVTFRRINLFLDNFPLKSPLDIIFCRNVMIYFDTETREKIIDKLHQSLDKDGYLFLGHSEGMISHEKFKQIHHGVFQKRAA